MAIFSLLPWRAGARPSALPNPAPPNPAPSNPASPKSAPAEPAAVFAAFVTALERLDPCGPRLPARPRPGRIRRPQGR